uniref:CUE domain-containing protein n=1 Tax=Macrostomum lignano TaxID=282301 RepID=A0A1I8FEY6_9PLAT
GRPLGTRIKQQQQQQQQQQQHPVQQQPTLRCTKTNSRSIGGTWWRREFRMFQCNSADNDEDPLLGEAGDGEDAESTDSFEEMVTFFPSVRLAVSLLPSSADLLQCLTASNAGDLMNLERLETADKRRQKRNKKRSGARNSRQRKICWQQRGVPV